MERATGLTGRRGSDESDVSVYLPTSTVVGESTSRVGEQAGDDNVSAISQDGEEAEGELDDVGQTSSEEEEWFDTAEGDVNYDIESITAEAETTADIGSTSKQAAAIADYLRGLPLFSLSPKGDESTAVQTKAETKSSDGDGRDASFSPPGDQSERIYSFGSPDQSVASGVNGGESQRRNALDGDDARPSEADLKEGQDSRQAESGRSWLSRSMGLGSGMGTYAREKWADSREAWSNATSLFEEIGTRLTSWPSQLAKTMRHWHKDDDSTQGRKVNTQDMETDTDRLPEVTHGVIRQHTGNTVRSQFAQVYQMPDPIAAEDEEIPTLSKRTSRSSWSSIPATTWKAPRPVRAISKSLKSGYGWLTSKLSRNLSHRQGSGRDTGSAGVRSALTRVVDRFRAGVASYTPWRRNDPTKPWSSALQRRMADAANDRVGKGRATEDDDGLSVVGGPVESMAAMSQESVIDVDYLPTGCSRRSGTASGTAQVASFGGPQGNDGLSPTTETGRKARHAVTQERWTMTDRLSTHADQMLSRGRKYWQIHQDESLAKKKRAPGRISCLAIGRS